MKHHFGDFLDRDSGHWTIVPNADRHNYRIGNFKEAQKSVSIVTMTKDDENWEMAGTLPNLRELTLHEPSKEQLEFVSTLWRLKRLRITHARPKSVAFLSRLQGLEELVLEYVSGFDDLAPVGDLKNLRAIHMENLRRVSDFSGLAGARALKYIYISGTLDWKQPIESFSFMEVLKELEVFRLGGVRSLATSPALLPLTTLKKLTKIWIPTNIFPMEEYALIETAFPSLEGATFEPCQRFDRYMPVPEDDIRARLSEADLFEKHPEVQVLWNGKRQMVDRESSEFWFIGKGQRAILCQSPKAESKCNAHRALYADAKAKAAQLLPL